MTTNALEKERRTVPHLHYCVICHPQVVLEKKNANALIHIQMKFNTYSLDFSTVPF